MISSENAIIFSYALWLIGRVDYGDPVARLREVIAHWFFMTHTTSRYSGSFETQVERDLAQLADVVPAEKYVRAAWGVHRHRCVDLASLRGVLPVHRR